MTEHQDQPDWRAIPTRGGLIGRSVVHHDFIDKVRGSMLYADDWQLPGMVYGKVVRAQRPSARILSVNCKAAQELPGVVIVMTAADVVCNEIAREFRGLGDEAIVTPVLAHSEVRYAGEPVAVVAAESPETAEQAKELVLVEYEELPGVFDAEHALEPDAHHVHAPLHAPRAEETTGDGNGSGNLLAEWVLGSDDVEAVLAEADVVVEGTYRTHRVDHAYLEPEAGVGWIESDGVLVLRVATQVIEHARQIAKILRLPQNKVRIIGTYMGGGFGGKEDMTVEPYLALLVWKTRRPVKMVWSRQESLLARVKRHPITMRYRTGASSSGALIAQDIELIGDAGAYPYLSPRVMFAAAVVATGPYRVPTTRVRSRAVFTNNIPTSAFRGFGAMQVALGYEGQMDRLAATLQFPPEEIRRRNFLRKGDILVTGERVDTSVALPEAMNRVLHELGGPQEPSEPHRLVGRGFACNMQPYGRAVFFADQASCWMSLEPDGSLVIRAGVTDVGGGQAASLCQIAGEVLGISLEDISVYIGDTALTPPTGGTFATRQLYMSGNATLKTAVELRTKLAQVAAELLDVPADELEFIGGAVAAPGRGSLSMAELVNACRARGIAATHLGVFNAEAGEFDTKSGQGSTFPDFTYGAHACDVEIDPDTGYVRVLRYIACHDVGVALNPLRVAGQIEGGAVQGIGYALSEEVLVDQGITQSVFFADYLIPAASDIPDVRSLILESGEGKGPFGARGIGEPPIGPAAPALASAIEDAIGSRLTQLPFGPECILHAMAKARHGASLLE